MKENKNLKLIKPLQYNWFFKNCKRQRKIGAKICQVCPFKEYTEAEEKSGQIE